MLNKENTKWLLAIITFTIVIFTAVQHMDITIKMYSGLMTLFTPLLLGGCMAFMINVIMVPIEKMINHKALTKLKRPLALLASLFTVTFVIAILIIIIVPAFQETIIDMFEALPGLWDRVQEAFSTYTSTLPFDVATLPDLEIDWQALSAWVGKFLSVGGTTVVNATLGFTSVFLGSLINILLGLVFAIYLLMSKESLIRQSKKALYAYFSTAKVEWLLDVLGISQRIFSGFITGQLTEALIIGTLCFIGMLVLQIPHALVVSALIAFTALIPVFGAIIGIAIGAFLILTVSPIKALWFVIFIIILQQLESNLIYPKVMGNSIGLPGIWVLVAVTLGGGAFGILGMLVGVPLFSIAYALLKRDVSERVKRKKIPVIKWSKK